MTGENSKIHIDSKDGQVLIGSHFHILEDETQGQYLTDSLEDFILNSKLKIEAGEFEEASLYFQDKNLKVYPDNPDRYSVPLMICNLSPSDALVRLTHAVGADCDRDDFEEFLLNMKPYLMDDSRDLLSQVRDFSLNKVTSMNRKKERNGDYFFAYVSESSGKDDFLPPETVKFCLPLFKGLEETEVIQLDFDFNYKQSGEDIYLKFKLRFSDFDEEISRLQKGIIARRIESLDMPKYYGEFVVNKQDDSWKYDKNTIDLG